MKHVKLLYSLIREYRHTMPGHARLVLAGVSGLKNRTFHRKEFTSTPALQGLRRVSTRTDRLLVGGEDRTAEF